MYTVLKTIVSTRGLLFQSPPGVAKDRRPYPPRKHSSSSIRLAPLSRSSSVPQRDANPRRRRRTRTERSASSTLKVDLVLTDEDEGFSSSESQKTPRSSRGDRVVQQEVGHMMGQQELDGRRSPPPSRERESLGGTVRSLVRDVLFESLMEVMKEEEEYQRHVRENKKVFL